MNLRRAVLHLALSPGLPKAKLSDMVKATGFISISVTDLPTEQLRIHFQTIMNSLSSTGEPLAAMSEEQARSVIRQICELSDDVSHALGGAEDSILVRSR